MAGRHSSSSRGPARLTPALLVFAAAALIAVGGFMVAGNAGDDPAAGCDGSVDVRVAVAPEISPVLAEATDELESDGTAVKGVCVDYKVEPTDPQQVAETLAAEPETAAHLWVPDFSTWVTRTAQSGATPATVSKSLARSPVVVVGRDAEPPSSWQEVGMKTVAYLDPLSSSASTAALFSAFAEMQVTGASETEMGSMMVPLAQRYGAQPDKPETIEDLATAAERGALAVMTEQQLVSLQKDGKAEGLTEVVPESGTMVLDYPLAALSPEEFAREAGSQLALFMAGTHGKDLLSDHGFRDVENTALESGEGLETLKALPSPDPTAVTNALRQWSVLTVPSRSTAVIDVSGSMDFADGGRPRIDLAIGAANAALGLFPDNAQIGLWAFSIGLGGGTQDYVSMAPVRPLGAGSEGATHRKTLAGSLHKLRRMTDGGTGLYDTTLAAVRTLQGTYDTRAINTVILLTDGQNEDPGSISLGALVETLQRERDPARPVAVIAVGMGPEADADALRKIAGATGGRSYVARDPADISTVFIDAMLRR